MYNRRRYFWLPLYNKSTCNHIVNENQKLSARQARVGWIQIIPAYCYSLVWKNVWITFQIEWHLGHQHLNQRFFGKRVSIFGTVTFRPKWNKGCVKYCQCEFSSNSPKWENNETFFFVDKAPMGKISKKESFSYRISDCKFS